MCHLVVDTCSMTEFSNDVFPAERVCDFGKSTEVHHVTYFRQPKTIEFLRECLWNAPAEQS